MEKQIPTVDKLVTIVVDMQNDFSAGGTLEVPAADEVVSPINNLIEFTRQNDGLVIATRDQHPEQTPHFDLWPVHCIAGTYGGEIRDDINIQPEDVIVNKGMGQTDGYSALEPGSVTADGQTIEQLITPKENETVAVLLTGIAADYCWKNTGLDTLRVQDKVRQTRVGKLTVYAVLDTTRAVNLQPEDGANAIKEIEANGAVMVNSVDVLTGKAFELAQ